MTYKPIFLFAFFVFLIQSNSILFGIELFSFSYDDDGLKASVLYQTVNDEKKIKEDTEKQMLNLLALQEEIRKTDLKTAEDMQNLETVKQKRVAAEENLKRKKRKLLKEVLKI